MGSVLILIRGDPKHHCGPLVRVGAYGGQVINGVLAQVHLTIGSGGSPNPPCDYLPSSEHKIGIDTHQQIPTLIP